MIRYRPFRNDDPPGLIEVWRALPPSHGRVVLLTTSFLETLVFSKPYFERAGLTVAEDEGRIVGFAHAGFGASDDQSALDTSAGSTALIVVSPHVDRAEIGRQLLTHSEEFMHGRGAKVLYGGSLFPLNPFYLGLYGGSELPGILADDDFQLGLYAAAGYREVDRVAILERTLTEFRAPVDRKQMTVRRTCQITCDNDPPASTWWEACTYGPFTRTRYSLDLRDGAPRSSATFWDLEPLASSWGVRAAGLIQLDTSEDCRRQGMGTYLISESLKQLAADGISLVQVQTMERNAAALALYQKLGFQQVGQGVVFRKE